MQRNSCQIMSEESQWDDDYQVDELAKRFEKFVKSGEQFYFDTEEFEVLIDYYQNKSELEKARMSLDYAFRYFPENDFLKIRLARQLAAEGKIEEGLKMLEPLEVRNPNEPDVFLTRGSIYNIASKYELAIAEYNKALEFIDEEDREDVYNAIAYAYESIFDYDSALEYVKKTLPFSENIEQQYFNVALCYEMLGKFEDGVTFFKNILDEDPYCKAAWHNLGIMYMHLDLWELAIDSFEYVLAIDSSYLSAYLYMGQAYIGLEKYVKAIEIFQESFQFGDPDGLTYYNMGECYEKLDDDANALIFYKKAIETDEDLADPWVGIGVIFDDEGKTEIAVKYLEHAISLAPFNTEFLLILADFYTKLKRFDDAQAIYEKSAEIDPLDPDLWTEYAELFLRKDELNQAREILLKGLTIQDENPLIMYYIAGVDFILKKKLEAYDFLEKALHIQLEGKDQFIERFMPVLNDSDILDFINNFELNKSNFKPN